MDIFEAWLNKKDESEWIKRALTDRSYKNCQNCCLEKTNSECNDTQSRLLETNTDLATYGDALIKFCYSEILLDKVEQLSVERAKLESDKFFVSVIARHYKLLNYIVKDKKDKNLPESYDYEKYDKTNKNPCKYIATAVEAMVGAIYKETKDLDSIIELLKSWLEL